jgi:S1-C subfamily serine protease
MARISTLLLAATMVLVGSLACTPKRPPDGPLIFEDEAKATPQPKPAPAESEIARTRTGTISRAELHKVLDGGVGGFLTSLEIEAYFEERAFWGWEIRRYDNAWVDLIPGDIIVSVNGKRIETPAQVQALWLSLAKTDEIIVSAFRRQVPFELRFTVQGEVPASAP